MQKQKICERVKIKLNILKEKYINLNHLVHNVMNSGFDDQNLLSGFCRIKILSVLLEICHQACNNEQMISFYTI